MKIRISLKFLTLFLKPPRGLYRLTGWF